MKLNKREFEELKQVLKIRESTINSLEKYIIQLEHDKRHYQESARTTQYCMNQMHGIILNTQLELETLKKKDKLEIAG